MHPEPSTTWARLSFGGARATLRLDRDPRGGRRAMVRLGEWAVTHAERALAPALERLLRGATRAATKPGTGSPEVRLAAALRAVEPSAELALLRRVAPGQLMPRWPPPVTARAALAGLTWGHDPERVALDLGLRSLLKREAPAAGALAATAEALRGAGLGVRLVEAPGHATLLAAASDATLDAAVEAERALAGGGEAATEAARALGRSLGYPCCCVERFVEIAARDDVSLAAILLDAPGGPAAPAEAAWLVGPLGALSHSPCSPRCPESVALGGALLRAIAERAPGFQAPWRALAERVHVVDRAGHGFALLAHGALEAGVRVEAAAEVSVDPRTGAVELREAPELAGSVLTAAGGVLLLEGREWASLAADHRPST